MMMTQAQTNTQTIYHENVRDWKSNLHLVHDELHFIDQLLQSYVFEPQTPNLFERLENYKGRLAILKSGYQNILETITQHDNAIGGISECKTNGIDEFFQAKHREVSLAYQDFRSSYNTLKSEVFNYCGGILKKHKK